MFPSSLWSLPTTNRKKMCEIEPLAEPYTGLVIQADLSPGERKKIRNMY